MRALAPEGREFRSEESFMKLVLMPKLHSKPCLATGFSILAIALSLSAAGQNSPAPATTSPAAPNAQSQDQSVETLKVNVEVVQLFFNVKDKHGALIPSLTKDNFDLSEDGQPQTIKYFKAESNLPLTLGILIDSSGSQMRVLDMEKTVGGSFLEITLRPKDEAFVISFDIDIDLLQDFTNSVSRLACAQRGQDQHRRSRMCRRSHWPARPDSMFRQRPTRHRPL